MLDLKLIRFIGNWTHWLGFHTSYVCTLYWQLVGGQMYWYVPPVCGRPTWHGRVQHGVGGFPVPPVGVTRHPDTHQAVGWEPRHLIPSLVGFLQEIYKQLIDICKIPMKICISWHVFYTAPPLPIISHIYQK